MANGCVTTAAQLLRLREPGFRHELVRGELRRMTPAGQWHGVVSAALAEFLRRHARERGLGVVFGAETGFLVERDPDTVLAPDAAFVQRSRLANVTEDGFFEGAPDLAVEVRSPRESMRALHRKARKWITAGAREVWIVDPRARSVEVLRGDGREVRLTVADTVPGGEVLPGLRLRVGELFAELPGE